MPLVRPWYDQSEFKCLEPSMVFFRRMTNAQSAAAWVLCGVLGYVYSELQEKERLADLKKREGEIGLYHGLKPRIAEKSCKAENVIGPKNKL